MPKITIEIKTCRDCPFFEEKRHYTADSFELAHDWFCKAKNNAKIAGYVEWHEEDKVQVPDWCPVKSKAKD